MLVYPTIDTKSLFFVVPLLAVLFLFGGSTTAVQAATFTVTNTNDSGAGSLRNQIAAANPNDIINFATSLSGQTITLTSGEILIDKNLTIDGSALTDMITISGNNNSRIFQINWLGAGTVIFHNLRLINGFANSENGGAVLVANSLGGTKDVTLTQMVFEDNEATFAAGAIQVNEPGTVTVAESTFTNNTAGSFGGAIENNNGTLFISNSTFVGNQANTGGAVYNNGPLTTHITNSTFLHNGASGSGSAVYSSSNGILHLANNIMYGTLTPPFDAPICNSLGTLPTNSQNWIDYDDTCNPTFSGNPYLMPLADNGGPTPTVALLPFSGASGVGDNTYCPPNDQRGFTRATSCDLGAYETRTADYASDQCQTGLVQGETYAFGATGIIITIDTLGSLTQLCVNLDQNNHPNATAGIQTGRHWTVTPTAGANNWSLTMSAPATLVGLDNNDKLCRYTGVGLVWDCALSNLDTPQADWISRSGITQLSDWAVGNDVGPTAVTNLQTEVTPAAGQGWLLGLLVGLLAVATAVFLRLRRHN